MAFRDPVIDALPRHPIIIGGQRAVPNGPARHAHVYPGTGKVTQELALADSDDVDRAAAAARKAFPAWRAMPGDKRRDLMFRIAALLEAKSADFAPSLIAENGSVAMVAPYMGYDAAQKFR